MAEQNRKTPEQRQLRNEAEEWVESYIDFLLVTGEFNDIAHEGRHILGIYQEHGEIPKGSGFSGFCTLGQKVDRARRISLTSRMIEAKRIMERVSEENLEAVCLDKGTRGKVRAVAHDPISGKSKEIFCSIAWCAGRLNVNEATYRKRVSRGYQQIENVIQSNSLAA